MVATRFAVATHILMYLAADQGLGPSTSLRLAESVNTNPVVVRRIAGQLSRAGLIRVRRGVGGAELAREPCHITLEDIWQAVNGARAQGLLPIHSSPNLRCPIGRGVRPVLGRAFSCAEEALHAVLAQTTLERLAGQLFVH